MPTFNFSHKIHKNIPGGSPPEEFELTNKCILANAEKNYPMWHYLHCTSVFTYLVYLSLAVFIQYLKRRTRVSVRK